jgi:hypothetical protein
LRRAYEVAPFEAQIVRDYARQLAASEDHAQRDPAKAVQVAEQGCRETGFRDARMLDVLGLAYAAAGRLDDAVRAAGAAVALARERNLGSQIAPLEQRLRLIEGLRSHGPARK